MQVTTTGEEVRLVVYRITCPGWLRAIGFGAWHAGIAVYGTEYSYVCQSGTGVLRSRPGCAFSADRLYRNTLLGFTVKSKEEVRKLVRRFEREWRGRDFDSLEQNCCHFCKAFAWELGRFRTPSYINRAANCAACLPRGCLNWIMEKWFARRRQQRHQLKEKTNQAIEEALWRPAELDDMVVDRPGALRARSPGGRWRPLTVLEVSACGTFAKVRAAEPDGSAGDEWDRFPVTAVQCNRFRVGDCVAPRERCQMSMESGWSLAKGHVAYVIELDEDGDFRLMNPQGEASDWQYARLYCRAPDYEGPAVYPVIFAAAAVVASLGPVAEYRS